MQEVPIFGEENEINTAGKTITYERGGPKFYRAEGELWREEWIEPAQRSERVRGDEPTDSISFVIDAAGAREPSSTLNHEDVGRYLWFDPRVISALSSRRGGGLERYTRDTGSVWCSPDWTVHFGVNRLELINVYGYDVAKLPLWQQRIWAGHNVAPDGSVSGELLDAQMKSRPARTKAPESDLPTVMDELDAMFLGWVGAPLFRGHDAAADIMRSAHRFRAVDKSGLLALAKDVARLTADRIDIGTLRRVVTPPKGESWRSLKHLEKALSTVVTEEQARSIVTPLVGAYDLRLGDAHLPSAQIDDAFELAGIDSDAGFVVQGRQLLAGTAGALRTVLKALSQSASMSNDGPSVASHD
jgi:hypothetical protein